jgi:beta-glucuronidase
VLLGEHTGGDMAFAFDLPAPACLPGENRLVLRVDNAPRMDWLPGTTVIERVTYGGILRPVYLETLPPVSLEGVKITPTLQENGASVAFAVSIHNRTDVGLSAAVVEIVLQDGQTARLPFACPVAQATVDVTLTLHLPDPQKWSPERPFLYSAAANILVDGEIVDTHAARFGIRTIAVSGDQILLNGLPLQIRGVNRYDEIAPYGPTVPAELVRRDLEQIKAAGFNLVRVHHPQETALLDLLDEIGLLLIEEVFLNWWGAIFFSNRLPAQENAGAVSRAAEAQLEAMIARDYNHPCIVLWSMGNECDSASPIGIAVFSRLIARAHHLDPTRLVTYAANGDITANAAFDAADVVGANSYPGVFDLDPVHHVAELEDRVGQPLTQELRAICRRFAGKPVIMTEYGTHGVPGVFGDARLSEDMQAEYIRAAWRAITAVEGVQGGVLWCWADYYHRRDFVGTGSMLRNAFGPFGLVTVDRKEKRALQAVREMFGG